MKSRALHLTVALVALATAVRASAALGEPSSSISGDQVALAAVRRQATAVGAAYAVEQLEATAYTVREYTTPSGVVFAVSWEGVSRPDLSVLLGSYAGPYHRALAQSGRTPGRRSRHLEAGGAVVETWGHMRALHGRAYLPALVPPGVSLDDIR